MCRLYGFQASHPTELDCDLVEAQNTLVRQSRDDTEGGHHPDGWGLGLVRDGRVSRQREAVPAYRSQTYRRCARQTCGDTVLAHVRKATVGPPALENTHPFRQDDTLLIHNGTIGSFDDLRPRMLEATLPRLRRSLEGSTDSEHFFHLLLTRWREIGGDAGDPDPRTMRRALKATAEDVLRWHAGAATDPGPEETVSLNVLWAAGGRLAGVRYGRSLWYVEREDPNRCTLCGNAHPRDAPEDYRAVVIASERVTDEAWSPVPESSAFCVTPQLSVDVARLEAPVAA